MQTDESYPRRHTPPPPGSTKESSPGVIYPPRGRRISSLSGAGGGPPVASPAARGVIPRSPIPPGGLTRRTGGHPAGPTAGAAGIRRPDPDRFSRWKTVQSGPRPPHSTSACKYRVAHRSRPSHVDARRGQGDRAPSGRSGDRRNPSTNLRRWRAMSLRMRQRRPTSIRSRRCRRTDRMARERAVWPASRACSARAHARPRGPPAEESGPRGLKRRGDDAAPCRAYGGRIAGSGGPDPGSDGPRAGSAGRIGPVLRWAAGSDRRPAGHGSQCSGRGSRRRSPARSPGAAAVLNWRGGPVAVGGRR
jgi:hypothetical protein